MNEPVYRGIQDLLDTPVIRLNAGNIGDWSRVTEPKRKGFTMLSDSGQVRYSISDVRSPRRLVHGIVHDIKDVLSVMIRK